MANNNKQESQPRAVVAFPFGIAQAKPSQYEMTARPNGRTGTTSTSVIDVDVPIDSCGVVISTRVYAEYNPAKGELTFQPGIPKNVGISSEYDRERFRAHALSAAQSHPEWDKLAAKAEAVLTGTVVKLAYDKPSRLVRTIAGKRETVGTVDVPAS